MNSATKQIILLRVFPFDPIPQTASYREHREENPLARSF